MFVLSLENFGLYTHFFLFNIEILEVVFFIEKERDLFPFS